MGLSRSDPFMERIRLLEEENYALKERVAQLEEVLKASDVIALSFGLSPNEAKLFSLLYQKEALTRNAAMIALYGTKSDMPEERILNVYIRYLRKKLAGTGVEIITLWGRGWRLGPGSKAMIKSALEKKEHEIA